MERYTGALEDFVRAGLLEESAARNAAKCLGYKFDLRTTWEKILDFFHLRKRGRYARF